MDDTSPTRNKWHTEMTARLIVMKSSSLATLAATCASMRGVTQTEAGAGWSYLWSAPADIAQWMRHTMGEIIPVLSHRRTPLTSPRR